MSNPSAPRGSRRNRYSLAAQVIIADLEAAACWVEDYPMSDELVDIEVSMPVRNCHERARLSVGDGTVECSFESKERACDPLSLSLADPLLKEHLLTKVAGWLAMTPVAVPILNPPANEGAV